MVTADDAAADESRRRIEVRLRRREPR
jgi:hypothetical protein